MKLNNRTAYRQPHSHPLILGREKCIKYFFGNQGRYPRPRILNLKKESALCCIRRDGHCQYSLAISLALHGINGVEEQVEQDLLQLNRIGQ